VLNNMASDSVDRPWARQSTIAAKAAGRPAGSRAPNVRSSSPSALAARSVSEGRIGGIAGIAEHGHARETAGHVLEHFQPLGSKLIAHRHGEAGKISAGARETLSEPVRDWIYAEREDDRDCSGRSFAGFRRGGAVHHDDVNVRAHELRRKRAQ